MRRPNNQEPEMTGEDIYKLGHCPKINCCLPPGLLHGLPRLEYVEGMLALQFWYYQVDASKPIYELEPVFYAAVSPYVDILIEMKALTEDTEFSPSRMDTLIIDPQNAREVKYLDYCAELIASDDVSEEQIAHSQALWLDAQCAQAFRWLYYESGIRPEAIRELLRFEPDTDSRHLLELWFYHAADALRQDPGGTNGKIARIRLRQMARTRPCVIEYLRRRVPGVANRLEELS